MLQQSDAEGSVCKRFQSSFSGHVSSKVQQDTNILTTLQLMFARFDRKPKNLFEDTLSFLVRFLFFRKTDFFIVTYCDLFMNN